MIDLLEGFISFIPHEPQEWKCAGCGKRIETRTVYLKVKAEDTSRKGFLPDIDVVNPHCGYCALGPWARK